MITVSGRARLQIGDRLIDVDPEELDESAGGGDDRGMGPEIHHLFTYTDDHSRQAEWTVSEYPMGALNNTTFHSSSFKVIEDFDFDLEHEPDEDDFDSYRERAVEHMTEWFFSRFQDPVNRLPHNSREGGYLYIHGGPYDARDQISSEFADQYPEELIEEAIDAVEADGVVQWDSTDNSGYDDAPYELDEDDRPVPNLSSINPAPQTPGPKWHVNNGRVVPVFEKFDAGPISVALHTQLKLATKSALQGCSTLSNKSPELLRALEAYERIVDMDIEVIDQVELYATGLDLRTRFNLAQTLGGRADDFEHPELSVEEIAALEKVIQLHAPFIQSTRIGASLTALAERELRSPAEERALATAVVRAAETLLDYPDIVDTIAMTRVRDYAASDPHDPLSPKRKAFALASIRNFVTVAGTASLLYILPSLTGFAVAGPPGILGGAVVSGAMAIVLRPIISKTKAHHEFTDDVAAWIDGLTHGEPKKLGRIAGLFTRLKDTLRPALGSPGIEAWFDALHADLERVSTDLALETSLSNTSARASTPRLLADGEYAYENDTWAVDRDGMISLQDTGRDLSVREIFSITHWETGEWPEPRPVYEMILHFSLKRWCDPDDFVGAWAHAVQLHGPASGRTVNRIVLERTIERLEKHHKLSPDALNTLANLKS
ncbi:MAG: hypothetical protein AAF311_08650 [Pseudomonadota bacterium]